MIALCLGLALSAPACAVRQTRSTSEQVSTSRRYTFPLDFPGDTLVCVEAIPVGSDPCVTLKRLRSLARDSEAD